jgi:hypothetical protein
LSLDIEFHGHYVIINATNAKCGKTLVYALETTQPIVTKRLYQFIACLLKQSLSLKFFHKSDGAEQWLSFNQRYFPTLLNSAETNPDNAERARSKRTSNSDGHPAIQCDIPTLPLIPAGEYRGDVLKGLGSTFVL